MELTKYVVGFAFLPHVNSVLLIRKTHPQWQAGKLNGIGGKVKTNETPRAAMVREFTEETGLENPTWTYFGDIVGNGYQVFCFTGTLATIPESIESPTDEEVCIISEDVVFNQYDDFINNVPILVPAAKVFRNSTNYPHLLLDYNQGGEA